MNKRSFLKEALGDDGKERKPTYNASFPDLCDIVLDDGELRYLTFSKGVLDEVDVDNVLLQPPPRKGLPPQMQIASLEKVLTYARNHDVSDDSDDLDVCKGCTDLFYSLVDYHKSISDLPNNDLYLLLALWDFHTYALEKAEYSPIIYFFSVAERGKSRTLKGMTYVAYRGIRKGDIRDSQLIRDCTNLCATLAFDMTDFWEKVKGSGSQDVILNRYERGTTVSRVNRPEKGAFMDTDYYDVFGATVLATNEIINDIADTRAIPIVMRKADRDFENIITPESGLDLKEQLTAWRYKHLQDTFPTVEKIAKSRLGDITRPLYQILKKVAPQETESFVRLIKNIEKTRLTEKASTVDAEILQSLLLCKNEVVNGIVASQMVTNSFNKDRDERDKLKSRRIASRLSSFGFTKTQTNTSAVGFIWDDSLLEKLVKEYGVLTLEPPESSETSESSDPAEAKENFLNEVF